MNFSEYQKGLNAYNKGDFAAALNELTPLAEQGNAEAQNLLGRMYNKGEGVEENWGT